MTIGSAFNNDVVGSAGVVTGSDGVVLPIDDLAHAFGRDGSGNLTSDTVVFNGKTYVQTYTYGSGFLTGVSKYVVQP